MEPIVRGRKLILQYTNGSPCGPSNRKRKIIGSDPDDKKDDDDEKDPDKDDDDKKDSDKKGSPSSRRRYKSTLISLLCDREPLDPKSPKVAISFIGNSPDECAYFFEARSPISCAGRNKNEQAVGPGGVFGIMYVSCTSIQPSPPRSSLYSTASYFANATADTPLQSPHRSRRLPNRRRRLPAHRHAPARLAPDPKLQPVGQRGQLLQGE